MMTAINAPGKIFVGMTMTEEWKEGEWTTVAVPKRFKKQVEKFLNEHPFYVSFAEFCRDAMRAKLERLQAVVESTKEE